MISSEFGRYRILSRIGEGGMGEVYLAEDPSLARKVALKFILPARGGDEHARRRLVHEARAAAHLDHPFICKVWIYEPLLAETPFGMEAQEGWFAAHVELGALYEKAGRPADARRLYTSLLERWKDGDPDLRLRSVARTRLARLPAA